MRCKIVVRPLAEADAARAFEYYESLVPGLGMRFVDELDRVVALIEKHPEIYQEVIPGVRRGLTRVFPYGVFYVLGEDTADIIAIVSELQDPTRWKGRAGT